ncbi:hypothetical protein [Agrobacterium sp. SUL3]|uniref:hypothetical protein n=1 Tax=Agrobacterium sp. SUL3 TaxID=1701910 RepID=UPI00069ACB94|nr:hypothetical protein [Agrobacterium sp. SUL3]
MPRTGGVFSLLSGSKGTPNTTIQSAPYNAQLDDFAQDANQPRPITAGGTGATNATQARTNLGLAIGSDVQGYDAGLKSIADLITAADQMLYTTGLDVYATTALTAFARSLLDDTDASAARLTLGLKALAILDSINNSNWSGEDLSVANGGTGASSAAAARTNLDVYGKSETYAKAETYAKTEADTLLADPWAYQPIGVPIAGWFGLAGTGYPPTNNPRYRYIDLSGGQTGAGLYNEGLLVSEVVSGSWPNIVAYATINLAGSPVSGRVVQLVNTSRMFFRPGAAGNQQYFAMQTHAHGVNDPGHYHTGVQNGTASTGRSTSLDQPPAVFSYGNTAWAATGIWLSNAGEEETRPRNIGLNYIMRIK